MSPPIDSEIEDQLQNLASVLKLRWPIASFTLNIYDKKYSLMGILPEGLNNRSEATASWGLLSWGFGPDYQSLFVANLKENHYVTYTLSSHKDLGRFFFMENPWILEGISPLTAILAEEEKVKINIFDHKKKT
jgi:hypothetical protein